MFPACRRRTHPMATACRAPPRESPAAPAAAGASAVITTLIALQTAETGLDMRHVLTINVPATSYGKTPLQVVDFYRESIRRIDALPGVNRTSFGMVIPCRDT